MNAGKRAGRVRSWIILELSVFIGVYPRPEKYVTVFVESCTKDSRRNKFTSWRERRAGRCKALRRSRYLPAAAPVGLGTQDLTGA
jgi:hypothetical protein